MQSKAHQLSFPTRNDKTKSDVPSNGPFVGKVVVLTNLIPREGPLQNVEVAVSGSERSYIIVTVEHAILIMLFNFSLTKLLLYSSLYDWALRALMYSDTDIIIFIDIL